MDDEEFAELIETLQSLPPVMKRWLEFEMAKMAGYRFILDEKRRPVPEPDAERYAEWMRTHNTVVAQTRIGHVYIATVFLGLNHSLTNRRPPMVFETLILGGVHDLQARRFSTWEDAEDGHAFAIECVKADWIGPWPDDTSEWNQ